MQRKPVKYLYSTTALTADLTDRLLGACVVPVHHTHHFEPVANRLELKEQGFNLGNSVFFPFANIASVKRPWSNRVIHRRTLVNDLPPPPVPSPPVALTIAANPFANLIPLIDL